MTDKLPSKSELIAEIERLRENLHTTKEAKAALENHTLYDPLTSLPGWSLFEFRYAQSKAYVQRYQKSAALCLLDLSHFKKVNDNLGHAAGNTTLCAVTERLLANIRKVDTVSRIGGDEFAILIDNLEGQEELEHFLQHLLGALTPAYTVYDQKIFLTFHAGAVLMERNDDLTTMMRKAKEALYIARDTGKNNYVLFDKELKPTKNNPIVLEQRLREALENDEFELYYQPQMDLNTGEITGMEALIRWHNPAMGMVSPGEFIPMAEDTGLVIPIGEWVIRQACFHNKMVQEAGIEPVRISVNLSALQFKQDDLVDVVKKALTDSGLEPKYLDLEITESVSMSNVNRTIEILKKFKDMGIKLSIDDFGTGYSSLSYLKQFPIHTLKIDLVFVRDITVNRDDFVIAQTIIMMAHNLGFNVIAEGVETKEQADFLRVHDCDEMQGYLLSKPLPGKDLVEFLKNPPDVLS